MQLQTHKHTHTHTHTHTGKPRPASASPTRRVGGGIRVGAPLSADGHLESDPAQKQKESEHKGSGPLDPLSGLLGEFRASRAAAAPSAAKIPAKFPRKFTAAEAGGGAAVDLANLAEEVAAQNLVIQMCVCV